MSSYRRRLAAIANKLICGIDFSKQPDNEIWYITIDGQKLEGVDFVGDWGKQQGLEVVSHVYENGIGKIVYNINVERLGESAFRVRDRSYKQVVLLISLPRKVYSMGAWSFQSISNYKLDSLVLLNRGVRDSIFSSKKSYRPEISNLYVMQGCASYFTDMKYNVIEKKI